MTSSVPEEGKTTLAVSLAVCAARLGRNVLLVDFDFSHPSVIREIQKDTEARAIGPVSSDPHSLVAIQRVTKLELDYLHLPVRGRRPMDPLTLFESEHMSELLRQLRSRYDCVIIDSAPLLTITESRLLASMVDKVIFAVKWASTRRDVAQNALSLIPNPDFLDDKRPGLVGAVITQVNLKKHALYRYADTGEMLMKFGDYYPQQPSQRAS